MSIGGQFIDLAGVVSLSMDSPAECRSIKALIFDLDGTLYHAGPVRRAMGVRLLSNFASDPHLGWETVRFIRAYRRAQEHLRSCASLTAAEQLTVACHQVGADPSWAAGVVAAWMEQQPLDLVRQHMRPGVVEFLEAARRRGLRLGLFSDYPVEAKLVAMGVRHFFSAVRWAQQPDVAAFKPNPRGLRVTLDAMCVAPAETLHIGDRPDVDAEAAREAGMPAAIIGRRRLGLTAPCLQVRSFQELATLLQLN